MHKEVKQCGQSYTGMGMWSWDSKPKTFKEKKKSLHLEENNSEWNQTSQQQHWMLEGSRAMAIIPRKLWWWPRVITVVVRSYQIPNIFWRRDDRICWLNGHGVWDRAKYPGWLQVFRMSTQKNGVAFHLVYFILLLQLSNNTSLDRYKIKL